MTDQLPIKASPARFAKLLQDLGYKGKVYDRNGFYSVESGADGHPFRIHFHTETPKEPETECNAFQIETAWHGVPPHEADKVIAVCNEFNGSMRYTTASLIGAPDDPFLYLTWDQFYPTGITDDHFSYSVSVFINMMGKLYRECKASTQDSVDDDIIQRHHAALQAAHGPDRDMVEAARLYRLSAESGYAGALNNLGDLYEIGEGVPKNTLAAVHYYTRAAERAEPTAYFSLSTILSEDMDDPEVLVEALKFAHLAVAGLPEGKNMDIAEDTLKTITAKLDEEDVNRARELAEKWKPLFIERRTMGDSLSLTEEQTVKTNSVH